MHVVCNNDGERQRFEEIWGEYGFDAQEPRLRPTLEIGSLARGFICDEANVVVVTSELEALYFLGTYDVLISRSRMGEGAAASRGGVPVRA